MTKEEITQFRVIAALVAYITRSLDELNMQPLSDFDHGQKSAFVECLEVLETADEVRTVLSLGVDLLDYAIETRYPV